MLTDSRTNTAAMVLPTAAGVMRPTDRKVRSLLVSRRRRTVAAIRSVRNGRKRCLVRTPGSQQVIHLAQANYLARTDATTSQMSIYPSALR